MNPADPQLATTLVSGFPKFSEEVFGISKIDGGGIIRSNYFGELNTLYLLQGK